MSAFRDNYTDFTFDGTTSRQMKVWITNSSDIQFRLTPEFSDTFVSPSFSNSQVLTNTNITKSSFQVKCLAIDVTMSEWRAIQRWLSPDKVGKLEFDFNIQTYYQVKVSKAITGKSFVKGGFDKLLGDLYIVDFTIDFTTVDDFAALSPVNVGSFNADSTVSNVLATSYNPYYIPMFLEQPDTFTNLGLKTVTFEVKPIPGAPSISGSFITSGVSVINNWKVLGSFIRPGDDHVIEGSNYDEKYKIIITGSTTKPVLNIMGSSDGSDVYDYTYLSLPLHQDELRENFKTDPITLFSEDIFYRKGLEVPDYGGLIVTVESSNKDYLLCNTGVYDMYPDFFIRPIETKNNFYIKYNNDTHYKYSYAIETGNYVTVDGRHGLVLSGSTLAEEVFLYVYNKNLDVTYKEPLFGIADRVNKGILSIPSGNAESMKCYVTKTEFVKTGSYDTAKDLKLIHIVTSSPIQYSHSKSVMHMFMDVKRSASFNNGFYPQTARIDGAPSYEHKFIGSSILKESVIYANNNNSYTIIGPAYELDHIVENASYYLSICDAVNIEIEGSGYIYLQSRGAF